MNEIVLKKANRAIRLIFLLFGMVMSSWAVMIPFCKERLELNDAELGMVLFTLGVGALLSMPFAGWLVKLWGTRRMVAISSGCLAIFLPLLAIIDSTVILVLVLPVFGGLTGCLNVSMNAHAVEVEKACNRPVMSGIHAIYSLGGLVGALAMTSLLERGYELLYSTSLLSLLFVGIVITQSQRLMPTKGESNSEMKNTSPFVMPELKIWFLGLLCFVTFMAEGTVGDWGAVFLNTELNYEPAAAGIGYALFSVAMATGRLTGDYLTKKLGSVLMVQVGGFLTAAGFLIAVNPIWSSFELVGFVLIGLGAANIVPILFSATGNFSKTSASTALTLVTTLGYTGILIGPAMIGFVAEATTLSLALSGVAFLLIVVGFCGHLVKSQQAQLEVQDMIGDF